MRLLLVFALLGMIAEPAPAGDDVLKHFERVAGELPFFALGDFLFDRELTAQGPPDEADRYNKTLSRLIHGEIAGSATGMVLISAKRVSSGEVSPLLRDEDPKVRTLAMAWLFANDEEATLPRLVELVNDPAETFPTPLPTAVMYVPGRERPSPPLEKQTVGDVARKMLAFYMERAGYYYGVEGRGEHAGFSGYWDRRGERKSCLSWFAVELDRATHGVSPLRQDSRSRVFAVHGDIDTLPPVEKEMALIGVFADRRELREVVSEQELVFAARRLGPERLLTLLRGEPLVDDPDLPHYSDHIRDFVLRHAGELLRPADGDWLIERGRATRKTDWFLAAAEVRPESASQIVLEAFETCDFLADERTRAATALWRLAGPGREENGNEGFLIDWFFEDDEPRMGRTPYRAGFVDFLTERFNGADRSLLARIVRDARFEQVDWGTLEALVRGLNRNLLHPVVSSKELDGTRHPIGKMHFPGMMERAREEYPAETAQLLTTLASWRERVRKRLGDWEPVVE